MYLTNSPTVFCRNGWTIFGSDPCGNAFISFQSTAVPVVSWTGRHGCDRTRLTYPVSRTSHSKLVRAFSASQRIPAPFPDASRETRVRLSAWLNEEALRPI